MMRCGNADAVADAVWKCGCGADFQNARGIFVVLGFDVLAGNWGRGCTGGVVKQKTPGWWAEGLEVVAGGWRIEVLQNFQVSSRSLPI